MGCDRGKLGVAECRKRRESLKLRDVVVKEGGGAEPAFMMVLIAFGYVSVTEKCVLVVPIGCLGRDR